MRAEVWIPANGSHNRLPSRRFLIEDSRHSGVIDPGAARRPENHTERNCLLENQFGRIRQSVKEAASFRATSRLVH